jgi:sigma-B regulation protein RsbU (phosphoserine phosphatase)
MSKPTQADQLRGVLAIARTMAATIDLDELLDLIVSGTLELLQAERASVLLYDNTTHQLVSRVATGEEEIRFSADRGLAGAAIAAGTTLNIPDAYADERFNPEVDRKTGFRTRSLLTVPLRDFEGALVGVLQVLNKADGGVFDSADESLAEALAAQVGVSLQRARLMSHYREKLEMERAMQIARDIQRGLLPDGAPEVPGFDLAGLSEPADETGGDTFDFVPLPDGRCLVVVADASGHGIGPALVVAETRAMLRAASFHRCDIGQVLATVNTLLTQDLHGRFVTCFIGLLDPSTQTLTYASAGHGPILLFNHTTESFDASPATSVPLGLFDDADYSEVETVSFAPGDFLAVTTDGFFEAANEAGEMYGVDRLMELLTCVKDETASDMLRTLHTTIVAFTGAAPDDDCTAVIVRRPAI